MNPYINIYIINYIATFPRGRAEKRPSRSYGKSKSFEWTRNTAADTSVSECLTVHRRRWMILPLIRLLRILHEYESTTNESVEYISTPDELSSDVERWHLQPEGVYKQSNKMISEHNSHFYRYMRT